MNLYWLGAALAVGLLIALYFNGREYTRDVEARWPAIGRFVEIDGVRLHVIERGARDAPPLLFLHGANSNAREFLSLAVHLESTHRLIIPDRTGYGFSSRPRRAHEIGVQSALFARLLEAEDAADAIVICHSLGCGYGLRLAAERGDLVSGLVLIAPASHPYPGGNAWWANTAAAPVIGPIFVSTIVPAIAPSASRGAIRNIFAPAQPTRDYGANAGVPLAFRPSAFRASARDVTASNREYTAQQPLYEQIDAPAIIVTSDRDRVVSIRIHAQGLARDLQASETVTLPGTGHTPHQLRPEAIVAAVARVSELAAQRRARD
ncbi:MAG: alpha/beta fold hydrolase [Hyphomonadaceae bacterium]